MTPKVLEQDARVTSASNSQPEYKLPQNNQMTPAPFGATDGAAMTNVSHKRENNVTASTKPFAKEIDLNEFDNIGLVDDDEIEKAAEELGEDDIDENLLELEANTENASIEIAADLPAHSNPYTSSGTYFT